MYIKNIILENFKSYEKINYTAHQKFNLLVGENNIGKTSIFDALLLWHMAYKSLITADGKAFYKKTNYNSMNINFNKLLIFRIVNAADLFFNPKKELAVTVIIHHDTEDYNLRIEFETPTIEDSYIRIRNHRTLMDFHKFAELCKNNNLRLIDAISINFAKPVSFIEREEQFLNKGQIQRKSYLGRNYETLRNKMLNTQQDRKFEYLEQKLTDILDKKASIIYHNNNKEDDEFIKISIKLGSQKEVDLSLVGSGILHILEIFSSLYVKDKNEKALNCILIDEPDSHIHADLQAKIIELLKQDEHRQILIISHNDRLIEKTDEGELFYINENSKQLGILVASSLNEYRFIQQDLSGLFTRLNTSRPIIITEGKTDWKHFKAALLYFQTQGKFLQLDFDFFEYENDPQMGDTQLQTLLKELGKIPRENIVIGIFDCDTKVGKYYLTESNQQISDKVFGISIPTPSFRTYHSGICVEFLYSDEELKKLDNNNRRIFLSEEFSDKGKLIENRMISLFNANIIKDKNSRNESIIIDNNVIDIDDNNIALSKNDFALKVLNKEAPFDSMNFDGFEPLFEKIASMLS